MFQNGPRRTCYAQIAALVGLLDRPGNNPNDPRVFTPCDLRGTVAKQSAAWRQWRPKSLEDYLMSHRRKIAFIGLGYAAQNLEILDVVTDVKMKLDRSSQPAGIDLWRL